MTALISNSRNRPAGWDAQETTCLEDADYSRVLDPDVDDEVAALRVLEHLAMPCQRCWSGLEEHAARPGAMPDFECWRSAAVEHGERVPLGLALARWIYRDRWRDGSLPLMLRHTLEHAAEEQLAMVRLLVEEVRRLSLRHGAGAVRFEALEKLLARGTWHGIDRRRLALLMGLATACRADEERQEGRLETARESFAEAAKRFTDSGASDQEIWMTFHELRSDLERLTGRPFKARHDLALAELCSKTVKIPGRLAPTLYRLGLTRLCLREIESARLDFHRALEEVEGGFDEGLRLEILHQMVGVEVQRRDDSRARFLLAAAQELYPDHGTPLMNVQRRWLSGVLAWRAGRTGEAEEELLAAEDGLRQLGQGRARLQVLGALRRLYKAGGRQERLTWVHREIAALASQPKFQAEWASPAAAWAAGRPVSVN